MREPYPSDISHEEFAEIKPILESARKKTSPRKLDLYDVFCAILYLLKTGCQWRMLPRDFPKWRSVHSYYQIWTERVNDEPSIFERALKKRSMDFEKLMAERNSHHFVLLMPKALKTQTQQKRKDTTGVKKSRGSKGTLL